MKTDPATLQSEYPIARGTAELRARGTGDRLPTMCWCERDMLLVPAVAVARGRTGSCGRKHCTAPAVCR